MDVKAKSILQFLNESPQFTIPIFQRIYSWDTGHCEQLWEDIMDVGGNDGDRVHLVGSVIYILEGGYSQSPLSVIDGQQRLTTVLLILEALARKLSQLSDATNPIDGVSERTIKDRYLLSTKDKKCKLILTQTDKATLAALLERVPLPTECSNRVLDNFNFFVRCLDESSKDLNLIWQGLGKLMIIEVGLKRELNDPQRIFESMNHKGKELSQADLIRNFVLMDLVPERQTRLHEGYWRPMEVEFGEELTSRFDRFMRDYLTIKNEGVIPNIGDVYEEFKTYRRKTAKKMNVDTLVQGVRKFAGYYCAIALEGKESDPVLAPAFTDFRELKAKVAYPLLLRLYNDYKNEERLLDSYDFAQIVQLIVSYIFRRAVCKIPTNTLNKTFATFGKEIDNNRYLESVKDYFLSLESNRRFPNDEEFRDALKDRDLYHFQPQNRKYWLLRLENHDRLERISPDEYSIEHIMPQDENLHIEWRNALGNNWKEAHQTWLHRLGNLTLTPTRYNSKYGNHPFAKKRDMEWGYHASPLRLNEGLRQAKKWDVEEIQRRGEYLANLATEVWKAP